MSSGWYEGALKLPGPAWKVGYTVFGRTSQKDSVIDHSSEGPFRATIDVLNSRRFVSWQFTNDDSGLYQHYPITDVCWHAGFEANKKCVGVENTGKDEPLTERQYENLLGLHRWLKEIRILTACERRVDLWEHNEWMNTDCPSGRIPWERLIADLEEQMPEVDWPQEKLKLLRAFLNWFTFFPETQESKDNANRQKVEGAAYQQFYEEQIAWREAPR